MSTIKNLALGIATLGSVATTNAQQTLFKKSQNTNNTIIELFQIRNGSSNTNVIGSGGYNQDISDTFGEDIIYSEANQLVYDQTAAAPIPTQTFPTEQIGNGTYEIASTPYNNNKAQKLFNWKSGGNTLPGGQFTINTYSTDRDAIEDGNNNVDMLHSKRVLPHTFDNGDPLPIGLRVALGSRQGVKDNGGTHASMRVGERRNGTARISQTQDRDGNPIPPLQSSTLGVNESQQKKNKGLAYPNPTRDEVFVSDGDPKSNELQEYHIYDALGRQVGTGKIREGQPISLRKNPNGNYIITTQDTDGDKTSHKVIKN